MASSVQELLLAAEAKAPRSSMSSLLDLLDAGVTGYQVGQGIRDKNLEIAKKLITLDQLQKEQEHQDKMQKEIAIQLSEEQEQQTRIDLKKAAGEPTPVMPKQKLTQKIRQDEKGRYSREIAIVPTDGDEVKLISKDYLDDSGQTRMGKWHPQKGLIRSDDDPLAARGTPDRTMQKEITKAKVAVAKTRPMVESTMTEIDRVFELNKKSFGGAVGSAQMKLRRFTGLGDESVEFKNTADVVNTMQSQVAKVLKSTFGGQLSDGERQYLNEVYGALPGMSKSERSIAMTNVKTMLKARLEGDESTLQELLGGLGITYQAPGDETPTDKNPMGLDL